MQRRRWCPVWLAKIGKGLSGHDFGRRVFWRAIDKRLRGCQALQDRP